MPTVQPTLEERYEGLAISHANLTERLSELEMELNDPQWSQIGKAEEHEFSREALRKIVKASRLFHMKNPLIRRASLTETHYVYGQGVTFKAANAAVDEIVQAFLADPKNKVEISSPGAMQARDIDLRVEANLFFAMFKNNAGDVRVRTIPFDQIEEVVTNPEDAKEPWYYLRQWTQYDGKTPSMKEELYPDWRYRPTLQEPTHQVSGRNLAINWDEPVMHLKVNALNGQRFGLSELYSAQDWARAYNEFLSNWATIVRSYARFAWKLVMKGKSEQRIAAKTKLDSGVENDSYNPAPSAGSTFIQSEGQADLQPLRTAGATTSASDGRRLLLMVCSATGVFEPYMGDPSTGNLATAKVMDRPMELQFISRQRIWETFWENLLSYVIEVKARAGNTTVKGADVPNAWGETIWVFLPDPDEQDPDRQADPIDTTVEVIFPDLTERDVVARVGAVVDAATLRGQAQAGTLEPKYLARQLLIALGEKSVEEVLDRQFPEGEEEEITPDQEGQIAEALTLLTNSITTFTTELKESMLE